MGSTNISPTGLSLYFYGQHKYISDRFKFIFFQLLLDYLADFIRFFVKCSVKGHFAVKAFR